MAQQQGRATATSHQLVQKLRTLGSSAAPVSLLPGTLTRLGLGDQYAVLNTPIGPLFLAYNNQGISAVRRAKDAADFEPDFHARLGRSIHPAAELPVALVQALTEPLSGSSSSQLRFDLRGLSPFECAVLLKTLEIPRGEVRPYAWVAREIGRPRAVRGRRRSAGQQPDPAAHPLSPDRAE